MAVGIERAQEVSDEIISIARRLKRARGSTISLFENIDVNAFKVDIHTNTPNLRIHASPTFFRRRWTYVGAPTTPLQAHLPPGIYEFGADWGPYPTIRADKGTFDIPYGTLSPKLGL